MKPYFSFFLVFAFLGLSSQEIKDKETFKKCRKEFNKKSCLADDDGDGVLNYLDVCKDISGVAENGGCPWPDTDGDGVLDKDDFCPSVAGPFENNGCPWQDTDGDGIIDKDDKCPTVVGIIEKQGCPGKDCKKFYEEEQERLKKFQEEAKSIDYKKLNSIILEQIIPNTKNEKNIVIITNFITILCGNVQYSCSPTYNHDAPNYTYKDFWNEKILNKFSNFYKKNILISKAEQSFTESNFRIEPDYGTLNVFQSHQKIKFRDKKVLLPIKKYYKKNNKVIENYDLIFLDFSNELGKIVTVNYSFSKVFKGIMNESKIETIRFQFVNNDWKLIETKN